MAGTDPYLLTSKGGDGHIRKYRISNYIFITHQVVGHKGKMFFYSPSLF
ncbi:hypothetical protein CLV42_10196 [Chitinophaga ginsengisoli]|uniref:Uncharacterized protein n=1 Tax=Chitinophaga ginsengisoli TaxID=363837 RepID=A0A2P8GMZ9_9BACT|nr:hypothetical protein CLV42_10196 [Chitinophaga ginsengisoli]